MKVTPTYGSEGSPIEGEYVEVVLGADRYHLKDAGGHLEVMIVGFKTIAIAPGTSNVVRLQAQPHWS